MGGLHPWVISDRSGAAMAASGAFGPKFASESAFGPKFATKSAFGPRLGTTSGFRLRLGIQSVHEGLFGGSGGRPRPQAALAFPVLAVRAVNLVPERGSESPHDDCRARPYHSDVREYHARLTPGSSPFHFPVECVLRF